MKRDLISSLQTKLNQTVNLAGWVNSARDHGNLIFIDLRDHTGVVQLIVSLDNQNTFELAKSLRDEFVISVSGQVKLREASLANQKTPNGNLEVSVLDLKILNKSNPLPINTHDEGPGSGEESRLKYRYLDLRRPSMQNRISRRAKYYQIMRSYMEENGFIEVTTPLLANSSPEGARDFLVPSRLYPGKFYALPQAPQQFKQLLMVGGVPRYYQIAPCFRDEDPRADRFYGVFYQLDLEMSFVDDGEEVRSTVEPLIVNLVKDFANKTLIFDQIPRLTYQESMDRFGTDKPDLRYGMEIINLSDIFQDTDFKVFQTESVKAIVVKNGNTLTRKEIDYFTNLAKENGAGGLAYLIFEEDNLKGPIIKFLKPAEIASLKQKTNAANGDAIFFAADEPAKVNKILGALRIAFADHFKLKDDSKAALCWITDFPFYEWDDKNQKLDFGHNPFSMPKGGLEALKNAKTDQERLNITADQYDMVLNGYEICSGAVRNHNPDIMYEAFAILGYDNKYVEERFGGMLNAFKFGAPPHAGCAFGVDRIFMILENIANIRDTVAFPQNSSGIDLMMNAPSFVDDIQLKEANIKILDLEP